MKYKHKKDKGANKEWLLVQTSSSEELDYALATKIAATRCEFLLPFTSEVQGTNCTFVYDVSNTASLSLFLQTKQSASQFSRLLVSFYTMLKSFQANDIDSMKILFIPKYVHVLPATQALLFAYLPTKSAIKKNQTSLNLLSYIAKESSFVGTEDTWVRDSLLDFIRRQSVLMLNEFNLFLQNIGALDAELNASNNNSSACGNSTDSMTGSHATYNSATSSYNTQAPKTYDFVRQQTGVQSKDETFAALDVASQAYSKAVGATNYAKKHKGESKHAVLNTQNADANQAAQSAQIGENIQDTQNAQLAKPKHISLKPVLIRRLDNSVYILSNKLSAPFSDKPSGSNSDMQVGKPSSDNSDITTNNPPYKLDIVVGRSTTCDITISGNSGISRQHILIQIHFDATVDATNDVVGDIAIDFANKASSNSSDTVNDTVNTSKRDTVNDTASDTVNTSKNDTVSTNDISFKITDLNSSNGTHIQRDGKSLVLLAKKTENLFDGDIIVL
ncbi:MAG: FHA domain-containing protein, partial [Coriobacteriales bacterium]|nr:FHA domain-containing protein [Coriobacteriales bacterium]